MPDGRFDRHPPDPGSAFSRRLTLALAVIATLVVVGIQNIPPVLEFFATPAPASAEARGLPGSDRVQPPAPGAPFTTLGRMFVKMGDLVRHDPTAMPTLDRFATTDADRLRAAIVAGEIAGDEEAEARLSALLERLDPAHPLASDARALLRIYAGDPGLAESPEGEPEGDRESEPESGSGGGSGGGSGLEAPPEPLPETDAEGLRQRHGFFAEVALTHHLARDHPDRAALVSGGVAMITVVLGAAAIAGLALLAGLVLFIVAVVLAARGKLRSSIVLPEPGGSVFLEVYTLFVLGFLALKGSGMLLAHAFPGRPWLGAATILLQWSLIAVVLWPLLRGMNARRWAGTIGLHSGRGVLREAAMGVLGYLAGLPVYLAGLALTLLALLLATLIRGLSHPGQPPMPSETIFEIIGGAPPLELLLFFSLAVVWAPLCEELVFRGALYRHFRTRWGVPLAAVASATLFGFMHGYGPLFVFPLIALGTVFAMMREWRGSLIAPMTAHFLHNATITVLLLVMLRVLA